MRAFLAVDLGDHVRKKISAAAAPLVKRAPDAKWVSPESMHVTLVFLGQIDDAIREGVERELAATAENHAPLELHARGGGAFGSKKKPRVLWVGLEGDIERLSAIQHELAKRCEAHGIEMEKRPYSPHLTLARARDQHGDPALAACADAIAEGDYGSFPIDELILFESKLARTGAVYTPIFRAKLTGNHQPQL